MTYQDAPVVRTVAEALAVADWTNNTAARLWQWHVLDPSEHELLISKQLPAARVAVNAIQEAA